MKAIQALGQVAAIFLSLSSVVAAEPVNVVAITARQQQSPSPTPTKLDPANTHDLNVGAPTPTDKDGKDGNSSKNGTNTQKPSHTTYDQLSPPGMVTMIDPPLTAGPQLYKVGDFVTWKWNYTNLQGTPTALDVLAACSACARTYTLTQNMTWASQNAFTWDTGDYQKKHSTAGLQVAQYTLVIYDADGGPSATVEPGYLGVYNALQFAMYTPQTDIPTGEDWKCASCSGAFSQMETRAIGFALTMSVVTVLSFTWFVTGFASVL